MENAPQSKSEWQDYHEATAGQEGSGSKFAEATMGYVVSKDLAIDLGAGSLRDSKFFANSGFKKVVAFDSSDSTVNFLNDEYRDKVNLDNRNFDQFDYPQNTFDLVYSRSSLHFIEPAKFGLVLNKILNSVKSGGILALNLLGKKDGWSDLNGMTFVSMDEMLEYLSDFELLYSREIEKDEPPAKGGPSKHWHLIYVIARKK